MGIGRGAIPNALSLSRVVLGAAFLLAYSNTSLRDFLIGFTICLLAIGSDVLDGFLARRWRVSTQTGYFLDGLGDKAFYLAVYIVILREENSSGLLVWMLIAREITLYALRSIDVRRDQNLKRLRPYSRYFALFIRLYFLAFFAHDLLQTLQSKVQIVSWYGDAFALIAIGIGYWSIGLLVQDIGREN